MTKKIKVVEVDAIDNITVDVNDENIDACDETIVDEVVKSPIAEDVVTATTKKIRNTKHELLAAIEVVKDEVIVEPIKPKRVRKKKSDDIVVEIQDDKGNIKQL